MTDKLLCPFCQQKLKKHLGGDMPEVWCCDNEKCKLQTIGGDIELWQELIRTRKALEIAVGALKIIGDPIPSEDCTCYLCAQTALEQITALEQQEYFADVSKKIEQRDE